MRRTLPAIRPFENCRRGEEIMKHKETCSHPELFPTRWNQPRPVPYTGVTCDCGMNFTCPVCGYGHGCYPCECDKIAAQKAAEAGEQQATCAAVNVEAPLPAGAQ